MSLDVRQRVTLNDSRPTVRVVWPAGRPATDPVVYLYHPEFEWDASPNPIVDGATGSRSAVNTTLNAVASAGSTSIVATDGRNVSVGDSLRIANALGQREDVEVLSITDGTGNVKTFALREPIAYAYTTAGTIVSRVCTYQLPLALDTTYWDDEDEYADGWTVRWVVGATERLTYFDFGLTDSEMREYDVRDLVELDPDLLAAQPLVDLGRQFAPQIDAAIEQVRLDLEARQVDPERVRGSDRLRELIRLRLAANLCEAGRMHRNRSPLEYADRYERRYGQRLLEMVTVRLRAQYDERQTGLAGGHAAMTLLRGGGTSSRRVLPPG